MFQQLTEASLNKWLQTSNAFVLKKESVALEEKQRNETAIDTFRMKLSATVKQIPNRFVNRKKWQKKIFIHLRELEATVPLASSKLKYFLDYGYGTVTTDFIQQVRDFDPKMDIYDTFQAIRNVWIMNSIQILFEMEVKLTRSIFAYSMLYPYSDNYLDDPSVSLEEKQAFNRRFKHWLMGIEDMAINEREVKLYQLIKMIELEFNRADYPGVYSSLLAIHRAQEKSLLQQMNATKEEILAISVEKGGMSVLTDAYLIRGTLTEKEAQFIFDYGVLLQLIDDLQDIEEDSKANHQTIFTQSGTDTNLDNVTNLLMNFIQDFNRKDTQFTSKQSMELKEVICKSALLMLEEAIAQHRSRFSQEYYGNLDDQSQVSFDYLAGLRETFMDAFSTADLSKLLKVLAIS